MSAAGSGDELAALENASGSGDDWIDDDEEDGISLNMYVDEDEEEEGTDDDDEDEDEYEDDEEDDGWDERDPFIDDSGLDDRDDAASVVSDVDSPVHLPKPGLPESVIAMLPTSPEIKDLFRRIGKLLPFCSGVVWDGVKHAEETLVIVGGRAASMRHHAEGFVRRALRFFVLAAQLEKALGTCNVPATATALVLSCITPILGEFRETLSKYARLSHAGRVPKRTETITKLAARDLELRDIVIDAQKALKIGTLGKISEGTVDPCAPPVPRTISILCISELLEDLMDTARAQTLEPGDLSVVGLFNAPIGLALAFHVGSIAQQKPAPDSAIGGLKRKHPEPATDAEVVVNEEADLVLNGDAEGSAGVEQEGFTVDQVLNELSPAKLAFSNVGQFLAWKERAAARFIALSSAWSPEQQSSKNLTSDLSKLIGCAVLLYQTNLYDTAAIFFEIVAATVRELYEIEPSVDNRLKLCHVLAALSIAFLDAERHHEAMRAAENGISLLKPLLAEGGPDPHQHALAESLYCAYAQAISNVAESCTTTRVRMALFRKSYRAAIRAVDFGRLDTAENAEDRIAKTFLSLTISTQAEIGQGFVTFANNVQQDREFARNFSGWSGTSTADPRHPGTETEGEAASNALVAKIATGNEEDVGDTSLCSTNVSIALYKESLEIYRELAESEPVLYEPLVVDTLQSLAEVYQVSGGEHAGHVVEQFQEVIAIYARLSETMSPVFVSCLESCHYELALRLQWEHRLAEADDAFAKAIHFRSQNGEGSVAKWKSPSVTADMYAARAMLCLRTERYEEAMAHARQAVRLIRAKAPASMDEMCSMLIISFCKWALDTDGQIRALDDALSVALKYGNQLVRDSASTKDAVVLEQLEDVLGFGWAAAAQCTQGNKWAAVQSGTKAVQLMRGMLGNAAVVKDAVRTLEPIDFQLPLLLVLLAGIRLSAGLIDEALSEVEEVIGMDGRLKEEVGGGSAATAGDQEEQASAAETGTGTVGRADGPTVKTALLNC
ncbi:hypothetical protein OC835_007518 [Tilletia horrida]|nr:hypothetical protein OC835_007518 [Tilletia horrida]